jgi:hypothetical protein
MIHEDAILIASSEDALKQRTAAFCEDVLRGFQFWFWFLIFFFGFLVGLVDD